MSLSADLVVRIHAAIAQHGGPRAAMLESLRLIQQDQAWVSDDNLRDAAAILDVTVAELDSLAAFYSLIFRRPVGETVILLCDGASCWLNGADRARDAIRGRLGIDFGQTTRDGRFTLINMACVGGCDRGPAAVVGRDRRLVGPLTPETLDRLLEGSA